ncbi:hypothetical protein ACT3SZ_14805 [Corynebacterium sp. AOP40-9SA-29]|uniref:hypothetical protein n=1 Tax=Corynebacterium sp. AOP40-9SA-29 TaxID=3457677 RepID=UPI004034214F
MITIGDDARQRVTAQYDALCSSAGTHKASTVLKHLAGQLPYPVEVHDKPAEEIHQCTVTGQASTDDVAGLHHITLASQLRGSVRTHTMAHELYHLAFHRIDQVDVDEVLDYYLTLPQFASLSRTMARAVLLDALSTPRNRDGEASLWEQEAECFASLIVSNSALITPPKPRTALFKALGEFRRVP